MAMAAPAAQAAASAAASKSGSKGKSTPPQPSSSSGGGGGGGKPSAQETSQKVTQKIQNAGGKGVGGFTVSDGAGALLALIMYGPALAYINGGPTLALKWFKAKFLNEGGGAPKPPPPQINPQSPLSGNPGAAPWRGGADNPSPFLPQPRGVPTGPVT